MRLAKRLSAVSESPIAAIRQHAADLRAAGRDVIGLAVGEPDFDTPDGIKAAGVDALADHRAARATPNAGLPALREAITAKLARSNGLAFSPDDIIVCSGGHQVLYNALLASLDPGGEVVIAAPYWSTYPDTVRLGGGRPVIVEAREADGFKLRPAALAGALTARTRWVILNSPCNPTGAVYTVDELAGLAAVLDRHPDVWVLSDEVYEDLVYDGRRHHSIAAIAPALKCRTLTLSALSKSHAMTGWRVGYGAGPRVLIDAMARLQAHSTGCAPTISQHAALAALTGSPDLHAEWRTLFARRRDLVVAGLNRSGLLSCRRPEGAFFVYPSCAAAIGRRTAAGTVIRGSEDLALYLLDAAGVAVVPGTAFGLDPYLRIAYATDDPTLTDACARIGRALAALGDPAPSALGDPAPLTEG